MNERQNLGSEEGGRNGRKWVFRDESEAATFLKRMPDERILPT